MNTLIQGLAEFDLSQGVYTLICYSGMAVSLVYSLWHSQKLGISKGKSWIILLGIIFAMTVTQNGIWVVLQYIRKEKIWGITTAVNSIVRLFLFIPLYGYILARILKLKWSLICDAIALYPLLTSGINQLACLFTGCCYGYPCTWGVYSIQTGDCRFPVPILETILTLGIFVYLIFRVNGHWYVSDGSLYPLMMVLYGIMRFVCELLRDNEKIFAGSSAMGIHAALMCVVGLLVLRKMSHSRVTSVSPKAM